MKKRRRSDGYDPQETLVLAGEEGLLAGETIEIRLGEAVVVGRSRSCDFSTRRSARFRAASEEEQRMILSSRSFLRVSRKHVRITYLSRDLVEIADLSHNGTHVGGKRVDRIQVPAPGADPVEIRLAESERLSLRRAPAPASAS